MGRRVTKRETDRAAQAWHDYLAMGPTRSIVKLTATYKAKHATGETVPTISHRSIDLWSQDFGWQARLRELAAVEQARIIDEQRARRNQILSVHISLKEERMLRLHEMCDKLMAAFRDDSKLWLRDDRTYGRPDRQNAKIIVRERFNFQLVDQLRGVMDDAAKEMGQRTAPAVQALMQMLQDERTGVARIIRDELGDDPNLAGRVVARIVALVESWGVQQIGSQAAVRPATRASGEDVAGPDEADGEGTD